MLISQQNQTMGSTTTHLLSQSAFWRVSKAFVEMMGLIKGFVLTDLIDKSEYYKDRNQLQEGFFYYRREDMLKIYPIGETTLRNLLKELHEEGLIEMKLEQKGIDRKTFYKINEQNVQNIICTYLTEKSKNHGIETI